MKTKIIIIHGNHGGTGNDQWIPWLKKELKERGFEVLNPTMPDNEEAKSYIWLPYLENELKADENTVLIGWSSGAVATMRYAETRKLLGSVLIATCYTDLNDETEKISGYYDSPWQWDAIKNNQQWIAQFSSTDDPLIPIQEARFIHENLSTEYKEYTDKKHFGWPEPMPTFPELLDLIIKKT